MKAIVIGSGVAGSTAAIALRGIGAEVTVFEARKDPAGSVGSFLSVASNGLRGLATVGVLDAVQDAGADIARQLVWSSSGRLLGDVPRGRRAGDDLHSVTLMRSDLVAALRAQALAAGAEIRAGKLVGARRTAGGVTAQLESGEVAVADLLVGADGIWSATRRTLDAGAPVPTYAGLWTASGVATGVAVEPGTFNLVFARRGAFIYVPAPDGSLWWSAQVADPVPPDLRSVDLSRLSDLFVHERLPAEILRATTATHRPTLHHVLADVAVWHDDRTVLIGDAAHPVGAGQGASLAIEDAVALARHLDGAPSIGAGLTAYEDARRARVAKMVAMARSNRDTKVAGPVRRAVQDVMMRFFFAHYYEKATGWLYDDEVAASARTQVDAAR